MEDKIKKALIITNTICLLFIILLAPLSFFLFNLENYMGLYRENGVVQHFEREELINITENLIGFFNNNQEIKDIYPRGDTPSFTAAEISHLKDVRNLTNILMAVFYSSIVFFILFSVLMAGESLKEFLRRFSLPLIYSSSIVILVLLLLVVLGSLDFWSFFEDFHKVFFPQGNYIFSPSSLIITLFPIGFFYGYFFKLAASSGILSVIALAAGILSFYYSKGIYGNK